jgi:hypothetical protein
MTDITALTEIPYFICEYCKEHADHGGDENKCKHWFIPICEDGKYCPYFLGTPGAVQRAVLDRMTNKKEKA